MHSIIFLIFSGNTTSSNINGNSNSPELFTQFTEQAGDFILSLGDSPPLDLSQGSFESEWKRLTEKMKDKPRQEDRINGLDTENAFEVQMESEDPLGDNSSKPSSSSNNENAHPTNNSDDLHKNHQRKSAETQLRTPFHAPPTASTRMIKMKTPPSSIQKILHDEKRDEGLTRV